MNPSAHQMTKCGNVIEEEYVTCHDYLHAEYGMFGTRPSYIYILDELYKLIYITW